MIDLVVIALAWSGGLGLLSGLELIRGTAGPVTRLLSLDDRYRIKPGDERIGAAAMLVIGVICLGLLGIHVSHPTGVPIVAFMVPIAFGLLISRVLVEDNPVDLSGSKMTGSLVAGQG